MIFAADTAWKAVVSSLVAVILAYTPSLSLAPRTERRNFRLLTRYHKKYPLWTRGIFCGAADRSRTDTGSPPTDFESVASANFTTAAYLQNIYDYTIYVLKMQAILIRF